MWEKNTRHLNYDAKALSITLKELWAQMHSEFILVFNVEQEHADFFLTTIRFNHQWNFPSISIKVISSIDKDFLNIDVRPYVVENLVTWYSKQQPWD